MALVAATAGPAGASSRAFGSGATFLPGVNAGNSPQLATGPDGTNLAVFVDRDDFQYVASTRRVTFTAWDPPLSLAKASGVLGPLYDIAIADDLTQVAASATGSAQNTLNKLVIWRRTSGASSWAAPVEIAFPATASPAVNVQVLSDGSVLMVWQDSADQIKAARVAPGASTFGTTENVSAVNDGSGLKLWAGRNGHAAVAWFKKGTNTIVTSLRATPTSTFAAAQTIPRNLTDDTNLSNYEIAIGDDGRMAFASESRNGPTGRKIKVWQRPKDGTWDSGEIVSTGSGHAFDFPEIGIDGTGRTVVAWQNTLTNLSNSGHVVQVTERGPGGTDLWQPPATLSAPSTYQEIPSLAVASDGTAGITWNYGDGQPLAFGEPGVSYLTAFLTQVSWRTATGAWTPPDTVSDRSGVNLNPVATAGNESVVVGWMQRTLFSAPYQAGLAASGPATIPSATLTVNSTSDRAATNASQGCKTGLSVGGKPECTLRAAIQTVNAGKGNAIDFDIAGGGTPRIDLLSALPTVSKTATIDGTTQAGGIVEVTGTTATGLRLAAPNVELLGLALSGFTQDALLLDGASGAKIRKNRFGTDGSGTVFRTTGNAVAITRSTNVTIGGDTAADGNQIVTTGASTGVYAIGDAARPITGLKVRHNTIGTDAAGAATLGTGPGAGVLLVASANGKATIADNLVVATRVGVEVAGAGTAETVVSGNTIGTNKAATAKLGTLVYGVRLDGSARSKVASNAIVANGYDVSVAGTVAGTFTDTGYTLDPPSSARATDAVTGNDEQVTGNRIGIFANGTKAPGSGSAGISVWSGTSRVLVQDNTIAGHSSAEISLARGTGHQVLKNRIGVDPTGTTVLGATAGIVAQGTVDVAIGTSSATGNQIGGTVTQAILLNTFSDSPGSGAKVVGNRIGLLADGTTAAPVGGAGVAATAPKVTIGPDNVIANSAGGGVSLAARSTQSTVTGNRIGTDASGVAKAGNKVGIEALAPTGSDPIRQDVTITGNTVSGNAQGGIVAGSVGLKVLLNRVGVGATTLADTGNTGDGIRVTSEAAEVRGNLVGHNADAGIRAVGASSVVADNQVGQPGDAETDIGNGSTGIVLAGAAATATGNVVGRNDGPGISVLSTAKGEVRGNRIGSNAGAGVVTESADVTIRENRIGVPATGDAARGNQVGIDVTQGKALIKANRIGSSTQEGVKVSPSATATILANPIFANGAEGIAAPAPAPAKPALTLAIRKGTGDTARTWLAVQGPDAPGTLEAFGNVSCTDPEGKVPLATKTWNGGTKPRIITIRGNATLLGFTITFTDANGRTSAFSTCATVDAAAVDTDSDGIPSAIEALGPWAGAQNDDQFAAVPTDAGTFVGLEASGGRLRQVTPADAPGGKPVGLELPFGLVSFELAVGAAGAPATVNVLVDGGNTGTAYWRYGPPDEGKAPAWYRFDYVAASDTGAKKITKTIGGTPYAGWELNLQDGARGDDDGELDSIITDPGGAGFGGVDDYSCPTVKGNARYVCRTYAYGLGRNPDPSGQAFWVKRLDAGTPRSSVMQSFITGSESRRVVVQRLYSTYLKRGPDPSGLQYWAGKLGTGTTPEALRVNLASSNEVYRTSGGTNRDYARYLYVTLAKRAGTDAEVDGLKALLDAGYSRASAVTGLIRSAEGRAGVVTDAYALYLERPPTAAESASWSTQIAAGLSELTLYVRLAATSEFANG
jgi:CSLREA domain-containing protein